MRPSFLPSLSFLSLENMGGIPCDLLPTNVLFVRRQLVGGCVFQVCLLRRVSKLHLSIFSKPVVDLIAIDYKGLLIAQTLLEDWFPVVSVLNCLAKAFVFVIFPLLFIALV